MMRVLVVIVCVGILVWAPWMSTNHGKESIYQAFSAFEPIPGKCYDSEDTLLLDGIAVRWYPFGRLIHTCAGDYVVWLWGDVTELGGVTKEAGEVIAPRVKDFTCAEVVERARARLATSSDVAIASYEGPVAKTVDYSLFPEAKAYARAIETALAAGAGYSGSFAVAEWECGSGCQNHAVIEVSSGKVIALGPETEYGVSYSRESDVLITNPLQNLPPTSDNDYEAEGQLVSIARVPREYYVLTKDALSETEYLVKVCTESAVNNYIATTDERLYTLP